MKCILPIIFFQSIYATNEIYFIYTVIGNKVHIIQLINGLVQRLVNSSYCPSDFVVFIFNLLFIIETVYLSSLYSSDGFCVIAN